jgi:glycosyltransferase involved in cell wall biosynthesis
VFSRPEQREYFMQFGGRAAPSVVVPIRKNLALTAGLRRYMTAIAARIPVLARPVLSALSLLDHVFLTLPYVLRLRAIVRAQKIDCIHQNNGFDVAAILLARLLRVPIVAYQRGDEWNSPAVRFLSKFVDAFVANSEATRQNLLGLRVDPARVSVIYPPVDFARFDPAAGAARARAEFEVTDAEPCFGTIGALRERKGHGAFLRAAALVMEAFPTSRAFIIGEAAPRDAAYREELLNLSRELGITDRVVFTGFRAEVGELIQILQVVVHASIQPEPFGRVIVEAMAMKKPVVASMAGGPVEIIENGRNGLLVPPGDHVLLAAAITGLLADPVAAARIAEQGHRDAKSRFSAPAHAEAMKRLYQEVLARSGSKIPSEGAPVGVRC